MSYDLALRAKTVTVELIDQIRERVGASRTLSASEPRFHDMSAPPFGDLDDLEDAFEDRKVSRREYRRFCEEQSVDPESDSTAGTFLQSVYGVDVLVVHLGSDSAVVRTAFAELRELGARFGLALHDPQAGSDVAEAYSSPM